MRTRALEVLSSCRLVSGATLNLCFAACSNFKAGTSGSDGYSPGDGSLNWTPRTPVSRDPFSPISCMRRCPSTLCLAATGVHVQVSFSRRCPAFARLAFGTCMAVLRILQNCLLRHMSYPDTVPRSTSGSTYEQHQLVAVLGPSTGRYAEHHVLTDPLPSFRA